LKAKKIGPIPSWRPLPRDEKGHLKVGDDIETFLQIPYSTFVYQVNKLLKEWKEGINILEEGKEKDEKNNRLKKEIDLAVHIYLSFKSCINIIDFYRNLREYKKVKKEKLERIKKIMKDELEITKTDFEIFKRNPEFGYHPEAFENFLRESDYIYKIKLLQKQLKTCF